VRQLPRRVGCTRAELLESAAKADTTLLPFHFPTCKQRDGYRWTTPQPSEYFARPELLASLSRVDRSDAKGLIWLRGKLQGDFQRGAVFYSGEIPFQIDDRIWAVPLSSLWRQEARAS